MDLAAYDKTINMARQLLLVAGLAVPLAGSAQDVDEPLERYVEQLQDELLEVTYRDGPGSLELIEPLMSLGSALQERGDDLEALAMIRRAQDVVRRNYGLSSLEQVPLIRQQIHSEKSLGRHDVAWDLEQDLLRLAHLHPYDIRTATIFRETAQGRIDILNQYVAGEWPPEIFLGCYYGFGGMGSGEMFDCRSGSRGGVVRRLAMEAHSYYTRSINVILSNEQFGNEELPALLTELLRSSYRFGNARLGERSLRFLLEYQNKNGAPLPSVLETLAQIADWKLLYSRSGNVSEAAVGLYERLHDVIVTLDGAHPVADALFSPELPVVLPAFMPNPLRTERGTATRGYIDVAFDVTRHGRARRVDIVAMDDGATRADKRELVRLILQNRYRPIVTDGEFADSSSVAVRYYVND